MLGEANIIHLGWRNVYGARFGRADTELRQILKYRWRYVVIKESVVAVCIYISNSRPYSYFQPLILENYMMLFVNHQGYYSRHGKQSILSQYISFFIFKQVA